MKHEDFKAWRTYLHGCEFKLMRLQDAPVLMPATLDNPEAIVSYLTAQLPDSIRYDHDTENLLAVFLSARRMPIGWHVISNGTLDTLLCHPREIFRAAIVVNAAALVLVHNHPSGDPTPSEADVKVTRDMIRAGQLLKIDLLDHVIIGRPSIDRPKYWSSLRELGYFYS